MTIKTLVCTCALAVLATACGPSFVTSNPPGFVELENDYDAYDYRATTAEGVVLAVRELDNAEDADVSFWLTAIKNKMKERGGYAFISEAEVKSADGVSGTQLRYGRDDKSNNPHLYYLTVFVTDAKIWLLEAGGTKKLVEAQAAQIDQHVAQFRTQ